MNLSRHSRKDRGNDSKMIEWRHEQKNFIQIQYARIGPTWQQWEKNR